MSKATAAICAAIATCIVTGAVADRLTHGFDFRARLGFTDQQQRMWHLETADDVKIELDDPTGRQVGSGGNGGGTASTMAHSPAVEVQVVGIDQTIVGMGPHEIRDTTGALLGTVVLSNWTSQDRARMATDAKTAIPPHDYDAFVAWAIQRDDTSGALLKGSRGTNNSGPLAWGYDNDTGLFWSARGVGTITVSGNLGGATLKAIPSQLALLAPSLSFTDTELTTPRLSATVDGKRTDYQGYGTFAVPVHGGKTITITFKQASAGDNGGSEAAQ